MAAKRGFDPNHLPENGLEFEDWVAHIVELPAACARLETHREQKGVLEQFVTPNVTPNRVEDPKAAGFLF